MTLTEFLLARIAEDEIVAQMWQERSASGEPSAMSVTCGRTHFVADPSSPARILAECEAKRMMLELHGPHGDDDAKLPCRELAVLALPYADHPDYNESWRP